MKVGKKVKRIYQLPKPIKVNWKPKAIPVVLPKKKEEVKKEEVKNEAI